MLLTRSATITDQEYFTLLLRLADRLEPTSRRRIVQAVERAREGIREEAIAEALRTLNSDAVLGVLAVDQVAEGLARSIVTVSREMVEGLGPTITAQTAQLLGVELEWEAVSHRALLWVKRHGAEMATVMSDVTRETLRKVIAQAIREPLSRAATVKLVRGAIGLNGPQTVALRNYWGDLDQAVGAGEISAARAAQLAERYRQRLLKYRATMITRTETMTAGNNAQREVWRAIGAAAEVYVRESVGIMRDGRICSFCHGRHGWRAKVGGRYQDGSDGPPWPHGGKGTTVGCRCQERLVREDDPEPSSPAFVEPEDGGSLRPLIE